MQFGACVGIDNKGNEEEAIIEFIEKVNFVKNCGFDYAEAQVSDMVELSQKAFDTVKKNCSFIRFNHFLPNNLKLDGETDSYLSAAFERVEALGGKVVVFGSGGARSIPDGKNKAEWIALLDKFFIKCNHYAQLHNVIVAIEPLNSKECNVFKTVSESNAAVNRLALSNIKVLADIYHMAVENEPLEAIAEAANNLVHVHFSEINRGYPGSVDDGYIQSAFNMLKKANYNSTISVECRYDDYIKEMPLALKYMKELK